MQFGFAEGFDAGALRASYMVDRRVGIRPLLPPAAALALHEDAAHTVDYGQAFYVDGASRQAAHAELSALTREDQLALRQRIFEQAARGVGYWYGRHHVTGTSPSSVRAFLDWLNGAEVLDAVRDITGIAALRSASAQVTCFRPGDFLTRHSDAIGAEQRRVAYAYYLSPAWHPDWGGLLMFFRDSGAPREAWTPEFNTLSLFDVAHVHSVTAVSAFAPAPRYAISGWFRTSPGSR